MKFRLQSHGFFLSITSSIVAVSFRFFFLLVCVISFKGEKMKEKQSVGLSALPTFFVFIFGKSDWQTEKKGKEKGKKDLLIADEIMISDRFARL